MTNVKRYRLQTYLIIIISMIVSSATSLWETKVKFIPTDISYYVPIMVGAVSAAIVILMFNFLSKRSFPKEAKGLVQAFSYLFVIFISLVAHIGAVCYLIIQYGILLNASDVGQFMLLSCGVAIVRSIFIVLLLKATSMPYKLKDYKNAI